MFEEVEVNSTRWFNLKDLLHEEWRDIKGYEKLYLISNYGRVKSLEKVSKINGRIYPTKILKCHIGTKKYLDVELCKNGTSKRHRIHRLVAECFIPNPENKPQINHEDCNKQNNRIDNLSWNTNSENQKHAFINGLNSRKKYGESPRAKKVNQYDLDGNLVREWDSVIRIKNEKGYSDGLICQCCKGKYNKAYGYVWRYKEEIENGMEI